MMVGLTIVAWGTSMPEVLVSSFAAWEGRGATSLGNALGSNVANIGLVLGTATLILPVLLASRAAGREILWLLGSAAVYIACRISKPSELGLAVVGLQAVGCVTFAVHCDRTAKQFAKGKVHFTKHQKSQKTCAG